MQGYLLTHPSLFIIAITIIIILLVYVFRAKSKYTKVEETSSSSIEMQIMDSEQSYDEPDAIAPLPQPALYKKLRSDPKKHVKYDVPRIHGVPELCAGTSTTNGNHLAQLEMKYNIVNVDKMSNTDKIEHVMPPVIHRDKANKSTGNRVSVSDVYKHGSYVSFDGEFDHFDDLSRRSNVMRITMCYEPDEPPINV